MAKTCYVYIMANPRSRILYTGVTGDLVARVKCHKDKTLAGFTQKYNITSLAYFEEFDGPKAAIAREKQIKGWLRSKKVELIETMNPRWEDLSLDWYRDSREKESPDSSVPQNDVKDAVLGTG